MLTENLKRYKDIAALILKYGRSDLIKNVRLDEAELLQEADQGSIQQAQNLTNDLEKLGPTFIKIGQLLSTRIELFPPECLTELERLQDRVEPFSYEDVEQIIVSELGLRISKAFEDFDAEPIAAASLGQVHRAVLRDGRTVAVKVQRPGIRKQILEDLDSLEKVSELIDQHTTVGARYGFREMVDEFRKTLLQELDYRREARHLILLKENLKEFRSIVIPLPIDDYSTSCVLTMEYIHGKKVTALGPLARIDLNGEELADDLFAAYLKQILVDGFFHADPHPGNVFLTDDGLIALLDLGMVGRIPPRLREHLLQLVLAISEGRGEEAAKTAIKISQVTDEFSEEIFTRKISDLAAEYHELDLKDLQVGKTILQMAYISGQSGVRIPREMTMIGKTLLNLDQVGRTLAPHFDPNACIKRHTVELTRQTVMNSLSPGNFFNSMIEVKHFLENLPARFNKILDTIANNQLKVKVDAIDELELIQGLQKIANRITLGLIISALIIGAAMLMRVETSFKILGYPGLAILFFLAAALSGLFLVGSILFHDRAVTRNKKGKGN
jgi:predicted unusual protein kinase regulating ubiquinone biosynthesis (AarF/ABC1/UbiB family)